MSGFIAWAGPSRFDGAPIVVIVTQGSTNRKTGDMDQAWIIRSDVHPLAALRSGLDASICGDCRHRGRDGEDRSCYVTVQHGPAAIYRAFKAGVYPFLKDRDQHKRMAGRFIRFGAYGDPTAAPYTVWRNLAGWCEGWTGYTHFWQDCDQRFAMLLMASVDTELERAAAIQQEWRTFRVRQGELLKGEMVCPASVEAGHASTCQQCRICSGTSGRAVTRSVAILPHGPKMGFYRSSQELLFEKETTDVQTV